MISETGNPYQPILIDDAEIPAYQPAEYQPAGLLVTILRWSLVCAISATPSFVLGLMMDGFKWDRDGCRNRFFYRPLLGNRLRFVADEMAVQQVDPPNAKDHLRHADCDFHHFSDWGLD